ncbi:MAG: lipid carrier--UDP-N-acetylgalactosaminyltransferase [Flavipsychrobacter sp.]|jgi:lipopolysaccharide/colanic/teichoic acid biosynthesis glycosyltransferase|nr:lipid carrier--UDP-N-acetylgalactosaminyltransferase [Flavipsychrobacter sp.]
MYKRSLKRVFDIGGALLLLGIASPFFAVTWLLLLINNNGKAFFVQPRIGKGNKVFKVIKFKTMNDRRDKTGALLPDEDRLTALGTFVRKSSLDELPQLLNVLKGDMSLIGPRPLLVEYLPLYSKEQIRRHNVLPGITGWAQVNGRNTISWEQKFLYDVWYVDNLSFTLDMNILWLTLKKILVSEGINSATSATMEKFTGSTNA